jgi:hypothetical protein
MIAIHRLPSMFFVESRDSIVGGQYARKNTGKTLGEPGFSVVFVWFLRLGKG